MTSNDSKGICVFVESPYSGRNEEEWKRNIDYARLVMQDCLKRGESPFISHLLYTQVPNVGFVQDNDCQHQLLGREQSVNLAFKWRLRADRTIVYTDYGLSNGMKLGIQHAEAIGQPIEYRKLF